MAPTYKLTYFDLPALGEPIRWMFIYAGIEFEDYRITREEWATVKPTIPYGQLPLLEHNGKRIAQSMAISRYVGKQVGLAGKDDWENLEIDAIADTFNDLEKKVVQAFYEQDEAKKNELLETVKTDALPFYISRFEDQIKKNNGYLVGGHLTWADFYVVCLLDFYKKMIDTDPFNNRAVLSKWRESIISNKNIQDYLKKHPL